MSVYLHTRDTLQVAPPIAYAELTARLGTGLVLVTGQPPAITYQVHPAGFAIGDLVLTGDTESETIDTITGADEQSCQANYVAEILLQVVTDFALTPAGIRRTFTGHLTLDDEGASAADGGLTHLYVREGRIEEVAGTVVFAEPPGRAVGPADALTTARDNALRDVNLRGAQLTYGWDLGDIISRYSPGQHPEWITHPLGPGYGARTALLATAGVSDPSFDPDEDDERDAIDEAYAVLGVTVCAYGEPGPTEPGWVLAANYIPSASLDGTLPIRDLTPPDDADAALARAADLLDLTGPLAGTDPSWLLCTWIEP